MRSSESSHSKPPLPLHPAIRSVHRKVLPVKPPPYPPPYPLDRLKPRKLTRFKLAHDLLSNTVEPTSVSWRSVIDGLEAQLVFRFLHVGHWCHNLFRPGVQTNVVLKFSENQTRKKQLETVQLFMFSRVKETTPGSTTYHPFLSS